MSTELLLDLDDYFCKKYNNQTKLAAIPGFVQPIAKTESDFADPERYKLCRQKEPKELLFAFKERLVDKDFSFDFVEVPFKEKIKNVKRKNVFSKVFPSAMKKYSLDPDRFYLELSLSQDLWQKVLKGEYYPSKNLLFAICLAGGISYKDAAVLLDTCEYSFDFESVRDTVVGYLLTYGVYNASLVRTALAEYKITCLPLKQD